MLKSCLSLEAFGVGKSFLGCALKSSYDLGIYVGNALLELYTRPGRLLMCNGFLRNAEK